ncbi:MAG: hypothetical protein HY864_00845 [Chloroflexi bacterium]|nr:hypothetical protein [Chloroflexota bacterium]
MSEEKAAYTVSEDAEKLYEYLRVIYTREQLRLLADLCGRLAERAKERRCEQTLTIIFNDKGLPRFFNGSDNVSVVYKPESVL